MDIKDHPNFEQALIKVREEIQTLLETHPFPLSIPLPLLREAVMLYLRREGKMLRPALLIWVNQMLGGEYRQTLPVAMAVELFHLWSLIHDDIIDEDEMRRGGPTVHAMVRDTFLRENLPRDRATRNGVAFAILAGDLVQAWCNTVICATPEFPSVMKEKILYRLNQWLHPALSSGEAMDVALEHRPFPDLSIAEIYHMLELKTGALLRFAAETGAILALGYDVMWEDPRIVAIGKFARDLGIAFQLRDDILGLIGDKKKLGKPVGSDLKGGKRTVLYAWALDYLEGQKREMLLQSLGNRNLSETEIRKISNLFIEEGIIDQLEAEIHRLLERALRQLERFPSNPWRDLLVAWANFACYRES